jgi:hypothetical protein
MAKKAPKPRPMKSRRNGLKDRKLIDQNIKVIKNIENQLKKD